jgi:hypothetical protein
MYAVGAPRMVKKALSRSAVCGLLVLFLPQGMFAQGPHRGQGFLSARLGTNLVGNTYRVRSTKPVPGAGASIGAYLSPAWAVEFETWMRASNPDCCARPGRETLYSLSVIRQYARTGIQPYALGGLTLLQSGSDQLQVQVGVGAQIPVSRRTAIAVDLRGNGGGSTMIVRPAVAAIYYFR